MARRIIELSEPQTSKRKLLPETCPIGQLNSVEFTSNSFLLIIKP
jgi:hypothetical protein